jgi:hypothetical protein
VNNEGTLVSLSLSTVQEDLVSVNDESSSVLSGDCDGLEIQSWLEHLEPVDQSLFPTTGTSDVFQSYCDDSNDDLQDLFLDIMGM